MNAITSRRQFLQAAALLMGSGVLSPISLRAVEPFRRSGPSRLLLSLAAYSFREYLDANSSRREGDRAARQMDLFKFVDFCAENGCTGAELTSYYFPKNVDHDYLIQLRRHCFLRGVDISGTAVGNTFTLPPGAKRDEQIRSVKQWVDYAAVLGAPHIRVFAGDTPKDSNREEAKGRCIAALEDCGEYAGKRGIFLGLENHGGIVAEAAGLLDIVRTVKSPWVGINLDGGNFRTEDPYRDFAECAPYAVNVQIKAEIEPRGQKKQPADLKRVVNALRAANYQGYVALEYESAEDPWKAVPGLLRQLRELFAA